MVRVYTGGLRPCFCFSTATRHQNEIVAKLQRMAEEMTVERQSSLDVMTKAASKKFNFVGSSWSSVIVTAKV